MKVFINSIPLFDGKMAVQAYRMCSRSAEQLFEALDNVRELTEAFSSPSLDLVEQLGTEPFAVDKCLFIELNQFQLLIGVPTNLNLEADRLVCVVPRSLSADQPVLERIESLRKAGYGLALDDFPREGMDSPLISLIDYIFIDCSDPKFIQQYKAVLPYLGQLKMVIGNIPDMETYEKLKDTPNTLFLGRFYSQPITRGSRSISPIKINALQLINEVNREDFDLVKIAKTIERDPSLSISLLRFINSAAVGLVRRVDSIRNAVAILGGNEVRRWATIAIQVSLGEDRPGEITRLSLIRAKMAENLAQGYGQGILAPGLFIAGLFSLLDVILQKPMAEAMREVAVDDRVRAALVDKKGPMYDVLELIYAYERADWNAAAINMSRNGVDIETVNSAFTDALVWYKQLLEAIDNR